MLNTWKRRGGFLSRLVVATIALSTGLAVVSVPSASAESERKTFIRGEKKGYQSERWEDVNLDAKPTVVHFVNCTSNPEVELWRDIDNWPDKRIGDPQVAWCLNTNGNWLSWGDLEAGRYYFKITDLRSSRSTIDVEYVHIAW